MGESLTVRAKLRELVSSDLVRARVEFWGWLTVGAYLNLRWQSVVAWVSFMSLYAIVTSAATKIEVAKAALEATEQRGGET